VVLGVGIVMAIGLFTNSPDMLGDLIGKKMPGMVTTNGSRQASCSANTVETIVGTIGCSGTKRAAHLERTTLVRGGD
jgi:hypothetical protein